VFAQVLRAAAAAVTAFFKYQAKYPETIGIFVLTVPSLEF
jgi:hypothetical protein